MSRESSQCNQHAENVMLQSKFVFSVSFEFTSLSIFLMTSLEREDLPHFFDIITHSTVTTFNRTYKKKPRRKENISKQNILQ
jgi:hypothetical protein